MSKTTKQTPQNIYDLPEFKSFYQNPIIQQIKDNPRWSVSDNQKRPIDIDVLRFENKIIGANPQNPKSMDTLDATIELLKFPTNHAYYLKAPDEDDFLVLDIEPKCPSSIKNKLLKLPYLYAEKSLSGKGFHLIMPVPSNYYDYPIAAKKRKLQDPKRYYEILANHWVTFTRKTISLQKGTSTLAEWDKFYHNIASEQREKPEIDILSIEDDNLDAIPHAKALINKISDNCKYHKTPKDFHNDMSRYEHGALHYIYSHLNEKLKTIKEHTYTREEKARLLFHIAMNLIPERPKHKEKRQNMPWLLYSAMVVVNINHACSN